MQIGVHISNKTIGNTGVLQFGRRFPHTRISTATHNRNYHSQPQLPMTPPTCSCQSQPQLSIATAAATRNRGWQPQLQRPITAATANHNCSCQSQL